MDAYKQMLGKNWGCTTSLSEVEPKILAAVRKLTAVSDGEEVVLFAFVDAFGLRGDVWSLLTKDRVVSGCPGYKTHQALLKDIKQVERKPTNIRVHSLDRDFEVFDSRFRPNDALQSRFFEALNQQWLAARR